MQTEKNLVNQHGSMRQSQLEAKLNKDTDLRQDDSLRNLDEEHHPFFVCLFVVTLSFVLCGVVPCCVVMLRGCG